MNKAKTVPGPVKLFLLLSLALNLMALACEVYARFHLHLRWPYSAWGLDEMNPDVVNYVLPFQHLHTAEFYSLRFPVPYMYPAPVAFLYTLILPLARCRLCVQWAFLLLAVLVTAIFAVRLTRTGLGLTHATLIAAGALCLSYPLMFELRQGNVEIFICLLVGLAVWCFVREDWHLAAVLIGIAGAMKIFPLIYVGLFLAQRRFKPLLTATASAVLVTVAGLWYCGPSIPVAWHGIGMDLAYYQQTVPLALRRELGYDHTLFAVLKIALVYFHRFTPSTIQWALRAYLLTAALGGVVLFVFFIRRLPLINQVLCLCIASVLLPPVSYDYTLLHLYVPWAMLVFFALQHQRFTPGLRAAFACFAVAFSITSEVITHGHSRGAQIKALALSALLFVALRFPFRRAEERLPVAAEAA